MDLKTYIKTKNKKTNRYTITGLTSSPEYDPLQEAKFA